MDITGPINMSKVGQIQATNASQVVNEGQQNDLKNHQTIRATVAEGGQDRVLLEFLDQKAWVKTKVPLKSGEELLLQLIGDDDTLYLKILNSDIQRYLQKALKNISRRPNMQELAETLREHAKTARESEGLEKLDRIIDAGGEKNKLLALHKIPRTLGLYLERFLAEGRVNDAARSIKAQVVMAAQQALHQDATEIFEEANDFLEMWQLIRAKLGEEGVSATPLPYPYLERGYFLDEGEKSAGEDSVTRRTFHLNLRLSLLGNMNITILKEGDQTFVQFKCSNSTVASLLNENQADLSSKLGDLESSTQLSFTTGAQDPVNILIDRLIKGHTGLLDRRV